MKIITLEFLVLCLCACCSTNVNKDSDYFNGEIRHFNSDSIVKKVTSIAVPAENYAYGMFAVYDSLAIFWNNKFLGHFFGIHHIDTGKEIGYFCSKGNGPKEMIVIHPVFQMFRKENDIMTLLFEHYLKKIFIWNISQSVTRGTTVYDTIVPYANTTKSTIRDSRYGNHVFYQTENSLMAEIASVPLSKEEATVPYYEQRSIYTNELIRDYHIYKKDSVRNNVSEIPPESFFSSVDVIKPDASKIVQAMRFLPQINILDTRTGKVVGCRAKNHPGFSLFETNMINHKKYYISVQADDNYIYATYCGKPKVEDINTIHVFDWNGKFICELKTDRRYLRISLDIVRNRLYTADYETDEIYYLDLNNLFASLFN
jgi:hypothetical protein